MSGMKLTRDSYEKLIAEDLAWLEKQPRTLEREHVKAIVTVSPAYEYGSNADAVHLATSNLSLQRKLKEARGIASQAVGDRQAAEAEVARVREINDLYARQRDWAEAAKAELVERLTRHVELLNAAYAENNELKLRLGIDHDARVRDEARAKALDEAARAIVGVAERPGKGMSGTNRNYLYRARDAVLALAATKPDATDPANDPGDPAFYQVGQTGVEPARPPPRCATCGGTGTVRTHPSGMAERCEDCGGTGTRGER